MDIIRQIEELVEKADDALMVDVVAEGSSLPSEGAAIRILVVGGLDRCFLCGKRLAWDHEVQREVDQYSTSVWITCPYRSAESYTVQVVGIEEELDDG